jgi:hypothetical protein
MKRLHRFDQRHRSSKPRGRYKPLAAQSLPADQSAPRAFGPLLIINPLQNCSKPAENVDKNSSGNYSYNKWFFRAVR